MDQQQLVVLQWLQDINFIPGQGQKRGGPASDRTSNLLTVTLPAHISTQGWIQLTAVITELCKGATGAQPVPRVHRSTAEHNFMKIPISKHTDRYLH